VDERATGCNTVEVPSSKVNSGASKNGSKDGNYSRGPKMTNYDSDFTSFFWIS